MKIGNEEVTLEVVKELARRVDLQLNSHRVTLPEGFPSHPTYGREIPLGYAENILSNLLKQYELLKLGEALGQLSELVKQKIGGQDEKKPEDPAWPRPTQPKGDA